MDKRHALKRLIRGFIILCAAFSLATIVVRLFSYTVVIASSASYDDKYTVYFEQTEAAMIYGPQQVKVVLKNGLHRIAEQETTLSNDGKELDISNWTVVWHTGTVEVTLHGEEQADEIIELSFTGDP